MTHRFTLLMVDDSPADLHLLETILEDFEPSVTFRGCQKAQHALEILNGDPQTWPDLILVDLNMPGMNGFEFMTQVKTQAQWRHIPLVVFSTSTRDEDKQRAFDLGANAYLQKPTDIQGLVQVVRGLVRFWKMNARPYDPALVADTQTG